MACRTTDAPFSSLRWASSAEASRTDAAAAALLATGTPSFFGGLAIFCAAFRASIRDQLVGQAFARRQMSEHASGPLYRCSPLNSGFVGFGGVRHGFRIAASVGGSAPRPALHAFVLPLGHTVSIERLNRSG
jgi:hypothetical protein